MDARTEAIITLEIAYAFSTTLSNRTGKYKHVVDTLEDVIRSMKRRLVESKKRKLGNYLRGLIDNLEIEQDMTNESQCALFIIDILYRAIVLIEELPQYADRKLITRIKYCIGQLSRLVKGNLDEELAFFCADAWLKAMEKTKKGAECYV
jgi:hypothetical protein